MLWIVLAILLLLWAFQFGLAVSGWWIPLLMAGTWLFFIASLFVRHEHQ